MGLDALPDAVLQSILARIDIPSLCSAAFTCRLLNICSRQVLRHLQSFHLLDVAPGNEELMRLLQGNTELQSIELDCSNLDDRSLCVIAKPCLKQLHLHHCLFFSGRLLNEIGHHCSSLRSLSLELGWVDSSRGTGFYSADLEYLLQRCQCLEALVLKGEESYFDSHASAAIAHFAPPCLKVLDLGYLAERNAKLLMNLNVDYIGSLNLEGKLSPWISLQKLSLFLDRITDSFVMMISQHLPCVSDLELQDEPTEEPLIAFDLTTIGIQQLGAFSRLQRLVLVRNQDLYPATFKRVEDLGFLLLTEKCMNLESIKLGGFSRISDASCRQILHNFPNLRTFELLKIPRITDLCFSDLSAAPLMLVSVTLASCNLISSHSVMQLSSCRDLETLNLRGCKSIGDWGIEAIATLSRLKALNLSGLNISDEALSILGKGWTPLVSLSLRGCQRVGDSGVSALVKGHIAKTLECIDLSKNSILTDKAVLVLIRSGMRIVELRLHDCYNIGDTTVIALASMVFRGSGYGGTLRLLDLRNCKCISLLSVNWLRKPYFPRLRWLGLGWNILNQSVLDSLSRERPFIRILDHGVELDTYDEDDDPEPYKHHYESEDELERWLRDV